MKKRKLKDNKNLKKIHRINNKINKIIIIIIAIIILILALFFVAVRFTGRVVGQVTGEATSTAIYNCSDSDNGIDYFTKGICEDRKQKYEDACYGKNGLWEYYCPRDKYACIMQESACPYGCEDGRCLKKGELSVVDNPVINSTETNTTEINTASGNNPIVTKENSPAVEIIKNPYLIILIVLVIVVLLILCFRHIY